MSLQGPLNTVSVWSTPTKGFITRTWFAQETERGKGVLDNESLEEWRVSCRMKKKTLEELQRKLGQDASSQALSSGKV